MKFMLVFPLESSTFKERVARFLETGAPPPAGVTMHGRWHSIAGDQGFLLAEATDATAIYRWVPADENVGHGVGAALLLLSQPPVH